MGKLFLQILFFFLLILPSSGHADFAKKLNLTCPLGYVLIPPLLPYTQKAFCVAKYEMKNGANLTAVSMADTSPWVNISRLEAQTKCKSQGKQYNLITNNQWQTIALDIAATKENWSSGIKYIGEINRGHSDNAPNKSLPAHSDDVNQNCFETQESCSLLTWNSQRRTQRLSTNDIIWDFSGNVWEWILDDNETQRGLDGFISTYSLNTQQLFGSPQKCQKHNNSQYCGYGYGWIHFSEGAIIRGGNWNTDLYAGIFATYLDHDPKDKARYIGFRCVFSSAGK